jgi:hypothetical protein
VDAARPFVNRLKDDSAVKKLLLLKISIVKKDYKKALEYFIDPAVKPLLLSRYMIDTSEILIAALTANESGKIFEVTGEMITNHPVMKFWNGELMQGHEEDSKKVLGFLEYCLILNQDELVDEIIEKSETMGGPFQLSVANALYSRGCEEKAVAIYLKQNDTENYGAATFVNLIEIFKARQLYEEALQFSVMAISAEHYDFRIFRSAIETAYEIGDRKEASRLCAMAQQHYSDSEWLRQAESLLEDELEVI